MVNNDDIYKSNMAIARQDPSSMDQQCFDVFIEGRTSLYIF